MKVCMNPSCKKEFTPKRERAKFCSDLCRASFHQAKNRINKRVDDIMAGLAEVALIEKGEKAVKLWGDLMKELGNPKINSKSKPGRSEVSERLPPQPKEVSQSEIDIQAQIAVIRAEKIPPERNTVFGKKSWAIDQAKRIEELKNQLEK